MSRCIGIDFINTNPRIAVLEDGKPIIIFNGQDGVTPDSSEAAFTQRLKQLKTIAEGYLGKTISYAGIAVPYFFNTLQRRTLVQAASNANFGSVRLLSECVTAAMTCYDTLQTQKLLVCSLHGNTFSVSAIEYSDDVLEETACAGTDQLDGSIQKTLHQVKRAIRQVRSEMEWGPGDPCSVLLLRDAGRTPEIRNLLVNQFGLKPIRGMAPDDCIAQGAALRACILNHEMNNAPLVLESLPQSMRVETPDGSLTDLFWQSPTLPALGKIDYSWDNGAGREVRLFHGTQRVACFDPGTVLPPQREKQPVKLYFDVDLNGVFTIFIQDPSNKEKKIPVRWQTSPLSPPSAKTGPTNHTEEIIQSFLPVYDNLERAMRQDTADTAYKKGVEMTMTQLKGVLAKLGITEIDALGKPFDPNFHNAVMHIDDGSFGKNIVSQVFQTGFMMGNKVIRFAAVQVAN